MPDDLPADEAAPLLCAGITVYNSLRNAGARAGDLVAVQGIGGLGHLGIQFARQMGFRTVAIGRGGDKEALVKQLGAHQYIDSDAGAPAAALKALGGAAVILATAPDSQGDLRLGRWTGAGRKAGHCRRRPRTPQHHPTATHLYPANGSGWPSGTAKDSEDTLQFSSLSGVRPMIERYPLEKVAEAYDQMISGRPASASCLP
jgi:D-arabinose 1-dehydrogenase-like Zn-dependent alcohol dehydrogenase